MSNLSKEEKEAIEILKNTDIYILGHDDRFEELRLYENAIDVVLEEIGKLQKENENLEICLKAEKNYSKGLNEDIKSLLNIEPNTNFISKDIIRNKIKELEKDIEVHSIYEENWNKIEVLKELLGE